MLSDIYISCHWWEFGIAATSKKWREVSDASIWKRDKQKYCHTRARTWLWALLDTLEQPRPRLLLDCKLRKGIQECWWVRSLAQSRSPWLIDAVTQMQTAWPCGHKTRENSSAKQIRLSALSLVCTHHLCLLFECTSPNKLWPSRWTLATPYIAGRAHASWESINPLIKRCFRLQRKKTRSLHLHDCPHPLRLAPDHEQQPTSKVAWPAERMLPQWPSCLLPSLSESLTASRHDSRHCWRRSPDIEIELLMNRR